MPLTELIFFQDDDGSVPFLDWFDRLDPRAQDKCRVRLERLQELGHELRRPEADFLRDGIHELRVSLEEINYRMLYFFHGCDAVVVSHGLRKERIVPSKEIGIAVRWKAQFAANSRKHSYEESESL